MTKPKGQETKHHYYRNSLKAIKEGDTGVLCQPCYDKLDPFYKEGYWQCQSSHCADRECQSPTHEWVEKIDEASKPTRIV